MFAFMGGAFRDSSIDGLSGRRLVGGLPLQLDEGVASFFKESRQPVRSDAALTVV